MPWDWSKKLSYYVHINISEEGWLSYILLGSLESWVGEEDWDAFDLESLLLGSFKDLRWVLYREELNECKVFVVWPSLILYHSYVLNLSKLREGIHQLNDNEINNCTYNRLIAFLQNISSHHQAWSRQLILNLLLSVVSALCDIVLVTIVLMNILILLIMMILRHYRLIMLCNWKSWSSSESIVVEFSSLQGGIVNRWNRDCSLLDNRDNFRIRCLIFIALVAGLSSRKVLSVALIKSNPEKIYYEFTNPIFMDHSLLILTQVGFHLWVNKGTAASWRCRISFLIGIGFASQ